MIGYVIRRLGGAALVLFGLSTVVYALFYLAPSDPAILTCGKGCTPERLAAVRSAMGVDESVPVQYGRFLEGLVAGRDYPAGPDVRHCPAPCLGYSFETDQPVTALLADRLPVSASLAFGATALAALIGVGAGLIRSRVVDAFVLLGYATPVFIIGLFLLFVFSIWLRWLPFPTYVSLAEDPLLWAENLLLPWLALAAILAASYARLTRVGVQQTMNEDYVRTARAYGLPERRILLRRALRGALIPVVTVTAIDLATVMTGAVLTETMFGLPGVGQLLVGAVNQIDLPVVVGVTMLTGCIVVLGNALADLLYAAVDPRVQLR